MKTINRYAYGFTLIELMLVVVIIGILASLAYPAYVKNAQKTKRAAAQADLMELTSFMERNFSEANRYDQDSAGNAINTAALPIQQSPPTGTVRYQYTVVTPTTTTFILTATPQNAQVGDDCATMTINQAGNKTTSGAFTECWQ